MSRAKSRKWVKLVAGLLLGTASPAVQSAFYPEPVETVAPAAPGRPFQAHDALNKAIEAHRHGDYEIADDLFREAETRKADLTPTEREELARLQLANREALAARRLGAEHLQSAETAQHEGRMAEAAEKLRFVAANEQYLTPSDRSRYQQLQGRPRAGMGDTTAQAHSKVQQARTQLGLYDLDAADRLAREADRMGVVFTPAEDSPKRVLQDVAAARADSKSLLSAARSALQRGEFDRAENYARLSDEKSTFGKYPPWAADSPSKALKDIESARKKAAEDRQTKPTDSIPTIKAEGMNPATPLSQNSVVTVAHKTEDGPFLPPAPDEVGTIKEELEESRRAIQNGDLKQARLLAEQARSRCLKAGRSDDEAQLVLKEIARAEAAPAVPRTPVVSSDMPKEEKTQEETNTTDAKVLLTLARAALQRNEFDRAESYAKLADKHSRFMQWTLTSDSPAKLLKDIDTARKLAAVARTQPKDGPELPGNVVAQTEHKTDEAPSSAAKLEHVNTVRVLVTESRQHLQSGDLPQARRLAEQARTRCAEFGLSDESVKLLLNDISRAEVAVAVPPPPVSPTVVGQAPPSAPMVDTAASVQELLTESRRQMQLGDLKQARQIAEQARIRCLTAGLRDDEVQVVLKEIAGAEAAAVAARTPVAPPDVPTVPTPADVKPTPTPKVESVQAETKTTDPKMLLSFARAALQRGEFDRAETYAKLADQHSSFGSFGWGDSPTKALRDIDAARKVAVATRTQPKLASDQAATAPMPPANPIVVAQVQAPQPPSVEGAVSIQELLTESRRQMQNGDLTQARRLAERARSLCAQLKLPDDEPQAILVEIDRAHSAAVVQVNNSTPAPVVQSAIAPGPKVETKEAAVTLLRQGRTLFESGKLDDAVAVAVRLKAMDQFSWGMFEDTPRKLQEDVEKVQQKHNQEESAKVLAEGRRLYEKGDYKAALAAAYNAAKLHGAYGWWETGDRPSKLVAEIETAQAREKKVQVQDPSALVNNQGNQPPATAAAAEAQAQKLLAEARNALKNNDPDKARDLADRAGKMGVAFNNPGADSPSAVYRDIAALAQTRPAGVVSAGVTSPPAAPTDEATIRARKLLAEARQYQRALQFVEALAKVNEAQKAGGKFNRGEDNPELAAQQLTILARKRIEYLGRSAEEVLNSPGDPKLATATARYQEAEKQLTEANRLATAFHLDAQPVALLLNQVQHLRNTAVASNTPPVDPGILTAPKPPGDFANSALPKPPGDLAVAPPPPPPVVALVPPVVTTATTGKALLDQAWKAFTEGDSLTARRLANEALTGNYGVQSEARAMLQAIATEEWNQQAIQARRNPPANQGQVLLQKARQELSIGQTGLARRSAEEAISGNYGVAEEAQAVLRTIDAEENNQRALESWRTFDAAVQAFNLGNYSQAGELLSRTHRELLDPKRKIRLEEMMQTAQMQPHNADERLATNHDGGLQSVGLNPVASPSGIDASQSPLSSPGRASASDGPTSPSMLETMQAMREIKFQKLRQQGLDVQREASDKFKTGQTDAALELLQNYINDLRDEQISAGQVAMLRRPVETRLEQFKLMKSNRDYLAGESATRTATIANRSKRELLEENKKKQLTELSNKYGALMKQHKYEDALNVALQVKDIDPDNEFAILSVEIAKRKMEIEQYDQIKKEKAATVADSLDEVDRAGAAPIKAMTLGYAYDKKTWEQVNGRKPFPTNIPRHDPEERKIENSLNAPADLHFQNMPLRQVIEDLRQMYKLNIYIDEQALMDKGIGLDRPVSIKLDGIALKSALRLMLRNLNLTYIIDEGALQIVTPDRARGKMGLATHYVADIVIPVGNFANLPFVTPGGQNPLPPGMMQTNPPAPANTPTPLTTPFGIPGGTPIGSTSMGTPTTAPTTQTPDASNATWAKSAPGATQEKELMRLITNVIAPQSWTDMGGPGTIDYHPLTMALVINQTPDIQEQIADLLAALRRLQDQEVAVEVKFISIADDFYERMGVNFSMSINTGNSKFEPQLTSGQFAPPGFANVFNPNGIIAGAAPAGTLTSDLAIPIANNTYFGTIPQFGGYPGIGVGGLTMGLAFLSDIQAYFFLEAVQGDTRTHITQAPKLSLFNGQTATLSVTTNQNFLTNISIVLLGNNNPAFQPIVTTQPIGVNLTVQAVITADRRFVRMSLNPTLTALLPGPILTQPVILPIFQGIPDDRSSPITLTQLIQTPVTQSINVATTVSVPDGGTVLLGGLKRLNEQRIEQGPPIISNIPILNRLFKNVGFGRETESLMLMVTPRIIIQEEEEERQTNYIRPAAPGL